MFFSLFRQRERTKRDHVARFESEGISTLRTELRDSLRSNRSSLHLKVPFSVVAFLCCLSRYSNIFNDNGNVNVNWLLFQQHYPALEPPLSRGSKPSRRSYINVPLPDLVAVLFYFRYGNCLTITLTITVVLIEN